MARGTCTKVALAMAAAMMVLMPFGASAEPVGKMTAEKATVTRNGGERMRSGSSVSMGDLLAANASGQGLIVFRDESSARLGPNAQLRIDEFVYDPGKKSGAIRFNQRSGVARIFGGQISKRGRAEVRTPHVVLGVRGGIIDVAVGNGQTIATLRAGVMTCTINGRKTTVTNPGYSCVAGGGGLSLQRLGETERRFVDAAGSGQGNRRGSGVNNAPCSSAAAANSPACRTRDTGLPAQQIPGNGGSVFGNGAPGKACNDPAGAGYCY